MGAKDHGLGGHGPKPQKRGGPGGGPKNRQILHTGGGNLGGGVFGGSRKTGGIKHEGFMTRLNIRFNLIVKDDHHR